MLRRAETLYRSPVACTILWLRCSRPPFRDQRLTNQVMRFYSLLLLTAAFPAFAQAPASKRRIIDVHTHIMSSDPRWDSKAPNPATGIVPTALNEAAHRRATIEQMKRYGVILGVISYENEVDTALLKRWVSHGAEPPASARGHAGATS